jgi:hypothetical protein
MSVENLVTKCTLTDPATLKPHPRNPNRHPTSQINALCKSLQRFGWRHSVIVSKQSGYIVAGHARVTAALKLSVRVPVEYQDFKDETEEVAFLAADNRIAELAIIDQHALEQLFNYLGPMADLDSLGYGLREAPLPPVSSSAASNSSDTPPPKDEQKASGPIQILVTVETEEMLLDLQCALLELDGVSWIRKG